MYLDYGDQCKDQLDMLMDEYMDRFGLDAVLVRPEAVENEYEEFSDGDYAFESQIAEDPSFQDEGGEDTGTDIKVMLGQPVSGYHLNDLVISYADKLEVEYKIITKTSLQRHDRIDVTWPDGKQMRLKVVDPQEVNPYSAVYYFATGKVI